MAEKSSKEPAVGIEQRKILIQQVNKFFSTYFNWVIAGIVVTIFASGFFFLLWPKYTQAVNFVNTTNQQQLDDTSSKQVELDKINKLISTYNGIDQKYVDKINAISPHIQNKEELFSELNYLVSVNQLSLQSISLKTDEEYKDQGLVAAPPQQKAIGNTLEQVSISMTVQGTTYESFKNFLSSIENNLRLMDIISVDFSPGGEQTTLQMTTYYSKN